jgi:3-hydroxybutyryl-CoA dehydrogenase
MSGQTKRLRVGVVGAGVMGRGIIQWAAEAGAEVMAFDAQIGAVENAVSFVAGLLSRAVAKGKLTEADKVEILGLITIASHINDLAAADIIIEAIAENLEAKRSLFASLEDIVVDEAILCTNTSSLSVTSCARGTRRPERIAGLHFFNPVPLMKVVEVIRGERTAPVVIDRLIDFIGRSRHHAVLCSDTPGFLINHAGRGLYTEGLGIVQESVASFADVDRVMREAAGFPMGPFELFDLTGLDVSSRVLREIYDSYFQEPRFRPAPLVYRRVDAGLFGRKAGRGFYTYDSDGKKIEPDEASVEAVSGLHFALMIHDPEIALPLEALLKAGGMKHADSYEEADVVVIAPLGSDATTAAMDARLDPVKVVAVDPFFLDCIKSCGRITLMGTPVTSTKAADGVHAALRSAGARVTRISDSPGFIAQRMIASIVNIASEIAQQRIATPSDIDEGVRRGLGYPKGPLALGDELGAQRIVAILARLHELTGDPRYRLSPWLRRRAALGISLTTPE